MVVVVAHPELPMDEVADHGTGPDARLEPSLHRSGVNQRRQFEQLKIGQPWCSARLLESPQALGSVSLVPLQPSID
jgi:hypothetical protein